MTDSDYLQVFISSVMQLEDLSSERDEAAAAIRDISLTRPWAFEYAPAEPNPPTEVYLREVKNSDLLVLIVSRTHTAAVQKEIEAAEEANVRILAFVRRLDAGWAQTSERTAVIGWLSPRVKYESFTNASDLRQKVATAVSQELVRGYRRYRIEQRDFQILFERAPHSPGLMVRPAKVEEKDEVEESLRELIDWYPNIGAWIQKVRADIGPGAEVRVADFAGEIAGLSIAREKEHGVRKFSTIYVRPGYRGEAIGPHLVYDEIKRAVDDGIRKAYVTFADELRSSIGPILKRYGFVYEGVSGGRYRPGSGEWVMGKTFSYETVEENQFANFVLQHFVKEQGGAVEETDGNVLTVSLPAEPLLGNWDVRKLKLIISSSSNPEDEYQEAATNLEGENWLFLSFYGRPANVEHWSHGARNWLDGEDLQARFYPVRFRTSGLSSLICTIARGYADALVPSVVRPQLLAPDRLQIRPDNVYYRAPDRHDGLRRGSYLFFYVSSPDKCLRGVARIQRLRVDSPQECLAEYGGMGILKFKDLEDIALRHSGKVLALVFDWYREYASKPKLDEIRTIVSNYNPIVANKIAFPQAQGLIAVS